jgi:B12-binding domain/radical SAM domain protein
MAALAALAAAVESDPATASTPVRLSRPGPELAVAVREASARGPVVVGWSFTSGGLGAAAAARAEAARATAGVVPVADGGAPGRAGVLHVAGGPHPSADPAGTLAAGFHLAAVGEGEGTLVALLRRVGEGGDPRGPGLAWAEAGRLRLGPRPDPVDLDACPPFPDRLRRLGPIEITRGCRHACRFCQTARLHGGRVRHRSPRSVAAAARAIAARGLRDVRFVTPSALAYGSTDGAPRLDAVEELLVRVREALGAGGRIWLGSFPSEIRPEHVTPEALRLLRRHVANDHLVIGAQSGSDAVLEACRRGHGSGEVRRAVRLALQAGFRAKVDLIFGLPGETPGDAAASRALASDLAGLGAEIHAHAFLPLPGTPWAGAPPGRIDGQTRKLLEQLAGRGRASGPWRAQEAMARALARPDPSVEGSPGAGQRPPGALAGSVSAA